MEILDLTIRVPGHPKLVPSTKESLMAGESFSPLPHSLQIQLLGQITPGNWLTAEVQDAAVLVAEDWVVSIHGKDLSTNVAVMAVLISAISQGLHAPVSVDLLTLQSGNGESLHDSLRRQFQRDRSIGTIKWGATIIASALVGALVQWLFFGGGLP